MTARDERRPLDERVLGFIREHHLLPGGARVVVAVSGGPDSVTLLHLLTRLRETLGISLYAAHLNHELRGEESDADASFVADLARNLGVPITIERFDVRGYQAEKRLSPEEAAREVRYQFLAGIAQSIGARLIAIGHTRDDNVETILMHLIRGSGTRGLVGLRSAAAWHPAEGSFTIMRPLLEVSREETVRYCTEHNLSPRMDSSNLSLSPLRNRIRLRLLPLLKSYNPRITEALLRTARIAADDLDFIEEAAAQAWQSVAAETDETITLDRIEFSRLSPALKRQILQIALARRLGSLKDVEAHHIEDVLGMLDKPAGKRLSLLGGLTLAVDYNHYLIGRGVTSSPYPPLPAEIRLNVPGETSLPGWRLTASLSERSEMNEEGEEFTAWLDFDKTGDTLAVRGRRPGDRFQPLGMGESKKLNAFMIDAKIPVAWRSSIPIVTSPEGIIWVVGHRIDERAKVTAETKRFLRLEFSRV